MQHIYYSFILLLDLSSNRSLNSEPQMHSQSQIRSPSRDRYLLEEVLVVAQQHPFYNSSIRFPPTSQELLSLLQDPPVTLSKLELQSFPVVSKADISHTIQRLCESVERENTFKRAVYFSVTGGGSGMSMPLPFVTDSRENRTQRRIYGELLSQLRVIQEGDVAISIQNCGFLYRYDSIGLWRKVF